MRQEVVKFAQSLVGEQEYPNNQGFKNPFLDNIMRQVGFENGWAWCSLFVEACWSYPAYQGKSKAFPHIKDNCSANAVRTYENFMRDNNSGLFLADMKEVLPGSMVIWEKRRNGDPVKKGIWTLGHAGIVEEVHNDYFISIEGNTNSSGGREGIEVARKKRSYNWYHTEGLCLKGFVTPLI